MSEIKVCSKCGNSGESSEFVNKTNVCKSCRKLHMQNYYNKNKEHIKEHQLKYYNKNKQVRQKYYNENKQEIQKYNNEYYASNKAKISKRKLEYEKNKRKNDHLYNLSYSIRRNINISIKGRGYTKKSKTQDILGCNFEEFKIYIESKFEPWMSWENKGLYNGELNYGWDLDHIIPLSSANSEEEIIKLNHYTNFQPLCSKVNRDIKKGRG
jgi:hypothetical protein